MKKLIEYIRLRKKGFAVFHAIKYNNEPINFIDVLTTALIVGWFVYISLEVHELTIASKKANVIIVMAQAQHKLNETTAKAQNLENVLINCLNGDSILVDNRNMDCQIKNYKEAIM